MWSLFERLALLATARCGQTSGAPEKLGMAILGIASIFGWHYRRDVKKWKGLAAGSDMQREIEGIE